MDSAAGQPATLATLVRVEGSSYRRPGARLLVLPEGKRIGSISGGCLDEDVLERADRVLRTGEAELATYNTAEENDLLWGVGTGCDGTVSILLEYIPAERPLWLTELRANQRARRETMIQVRYGGHDSRGTQLSARGATVEPDVFQETVLASPALLICGAGDDAQPLVRMAKETGWHVTVADTRPAYANAQRFPDADRILSGAIDETMAQLKIDSRTFAVVMTHRFEDDWKFLGALLS
ncbi:MAG TPA: XdhC family protein, partial [Opitutaceae bacterium]